MNSKRWMGFSLLLMLVSGGAHAQTTDTGKLSEGLIYSVNRTPERPFETSRAVEVITREEIWRKNATTLTDILDEEAGFLKYRTSNSAASPVLRGMVGRQVLVLIDGVKVNNALSGDTPNLDLVDISQIERIEIVRGVVSVLGTEALGGVINIITRKGTESNHAVGLSVGAQYVSGSDTFSTPVRVYQQNGKYRWTAGVNLQQFGESRGGKGVGTQPYTDYEQRAADVSFDYFASADKTLSFAYRTSAQEDAKNNSSIVSGTSLESVTTPNTLTLASLAYQDLTDRGWTQSIRLTGYLNDQDNGTVEVRRVTPDRETSFLDEDRMFGLNLELGSFLGRHHLVYGVDLTSETIDSTTSDRTLSTNTVTSRRGRFTDDAEYSSAGIYLQDHFSITQRFTATAGVRYGIFRSQGSETLPIVGAVDLAGSESDVTGALNLTYHATPSLNIIANVMRGFRAANLRDISRFSSSATNVEIPATDAAAERVMSYEAGLKFDRGMFSGSAFFFRNNLSNLLIVTNSTFRGLPFIDANGNGVRDTGEPAVRENRNQGDAVIDGYELEARVTPRAWLSIFANYTASEGQSDDAVPATLLQRVPPPAGAAGVRVTSGGRWSPWGELVFSFNKPYTLDGVELTPASDEISLRTGFTPTNWLRLAVSGENLTDERYIPRFTATAHPGRRVVVTTEFRF